MGKLLMVLYALFFVFLFVAMFQASHSRNYGGGAPVLPVLNTTSLWKSTDTPAVVDTSDATTLVLGVQFIPQVDGNATGCKFYKAFANIGPHVCTLWTSGGTQLASVTFSGEGVSGWQEQDFTIPIALTSGTTYVIGVYTGSGHYSKDDSYFVSQHVSDVDGMLVAPASSSTVNGNGNGVYVATSTPTTFPTSTFNSSNYWTDVVFQYYSTPSSGSLLPPDRDVSANWQTAGMLSVGGIPNRTTQCGATISPLGSGLDDATNIENAITACPVGEVVQLAAGTFIINGGNYLTIDKGVTLRGAGAGQTILAKTDGSHMEPGAGQGANPSPLIVVGIARFGVEAGTPTNLTADAAKGANSIQVTSAAGFVVGQIVLLDQVSNGGWQSDVTGTATSVWASPDYLVVWKKHNPSQSNDDFDATTYPYQPGTNGDQYSRLDRPNNEIKEISAIAGNIITFTSPMTMTYRVSQTAQLVGFVNSGSTTYAPHVKNAGIEGLSTQGGDDGAIAFNWCAYCWAKNVENSIWLGRGVDLQSSFRVELQRFYSHDASYSQPGGGAYAIGIDSASSEILIEDSISIRANKVMVARASGAGSVVGYSYTDMGFIDYNEGWIEIGLNGSHFVGSHHMLFEGNYGVNGDSDNTHGSSVYHTFFRNWLRGIRHSFVNPQTGHTVDDASSPGSPLRTVGPMSYSYWFSFIGNVLGASGQMGGWAYEGGDPAIYTPGWGDAGTSGVWHTDPQVTSLSFPGHMIREGNWDWQTSSQKWQSLPAGFAIPNSLYRSSKPTFFGTNPWPWVDPTTGAVNTLPAKARFDAGTPNG